MNAHYFKKWLAAFATSFAHLSNRQHYLRAVMHSTCQQALFAMCTSPVSIDTQEDDTRKRRCGTFDIGLDDLSRRSQFLPPPCEVLSLVLMLFGC